MSKYRDPEKRRDYQRELMRRRRAESKSPTGESPSTGEITSQESPPPSSGVSQGLLADSEHGIPSQDRTAASNLAHPNAPVYIEVDEVQKIRDDWKDVPNQWVKFPGKEGWPCCKAPGRCCLPYLHDEPRRKIDACVFLYSRCAFYRDVTTRELMNGKDDGN